MNTTFPMEAGRIFVAADGVTIPGSGNLVTVRQHAVHRAHGIRPGDPPPTCWIGCSADRHGVWRCLAFSVLHSARVSNGRCVAHQVPLDSDSVILTVGATYVWHTDLGTTEYLIDIKVTMPLANSPHNCSCSGKGANSVGQPKPCLDQNPFPFDWQRPAAAAGLTVTELAVEPGALAPAFSPGHHLYTVAETDYHTDTCAVIATPGATDSKVAQLAHGPSASAQHSALLPAQRPKPPRRSRSLQKASQAPIACPPALTATTSPSASAETDLVPPSPAHTHPQCSTA